MYLIIIYALAVTVMVYFSVTRGPDRSVIRKSSSATLFWIALTLLTLYGALWLVFGVGEIAGGDLSGLSHLIPAVLIYTLIYLCWRRPLEGGIILVISAVLSGLRDISGWLAGKNASFFLIGILPPFLAGLLLIIAKIVITRAVKLKTENTEKR
jgi:hypothetical protein